MKTTNAKMNCPNCGTEINVDELLISQFQDSIKKDLESELQIRKEELSQEKMEFKKLSLEFTKEKETLEETIQAKVKAQLSSREESLKEAIRKEINDEKSLQLQDLESELIKKSAQLKDLNGTKAQLERLRRDMEEAETRIVLEKEKDNFGLWRCNTFNLACTISSWNCSSFWIYYSWNYDLSYVKKSRQ